jgi:DNA-binding HxlR family transcriptional regulator
MSDTPHRSAGAREFRAPARLFAAHTGRPIVAAFDLLSRRWMLRILWALRSGPIGFRALQRRCDELSPTVLSTRLAELRAAILVAQDHTRPHHLTPLGEDLLTALRPLNDWSRRWARKDHG